MGGYQDASVVSRVMWLCVVSRVLLSRFCYAVGGCQGVAMWFQGCCTVCGSQAVAMWLLGCYQGVAMQFQGFCVWLPGCCYIVTRMLWVVTRALQCSFIITS